MWTTRKTLSFIKDFRLNECLWKVKNKDYKDRDKKDSALVFLSEKYQCEVKDVERKISNLRAQFRRQHKKVARIKKGSSSSKSVWFAYKPLLFLTKESAGTRTIEDQRCPKAENADESNAEAEAAATTSSYEETEEEWERDRFQQPNALKTNKRLESSFELEAAECLKKLTEAVCKQDDFSTYGHYIAAKLRNSGRSKKEIAIAQYHMEEVVFNLVMGFYSEDQQYAETYMESETYTTPQTHTAPYTYTSSETQTTPAPSSTNTDCNN